MVISVFVPGAALRVIEGYPRGLDYSSPQGVPLWIPWDPGHMALGYLEPFREV